MRGGKQHRDSRGRFARAPPRLLPAVRSATMQLSFKKRHEEGKDGSLIERMLRPLVEGVPVVLSVRGSRAPKRRRMRNDPLLFITPASCFGGDRQVLVMSLQGRGCEVFDMRENLKSIAIIRIGLDISLAVQLANALNLVFNK